MPRMESPMPSPTSANPDLIPNVVVASASPRNLTFKQSIWNHLVSSGEVIFPTDSAIPQGRCPCLNNPLFAGITFLRCLLLPIDVFILYSSSDSFLSAGWQDTYSGITE